jgi:hypothetical protein
MLPPLSDLNDDYFILYISTFGNYATVARTKCKQMTGMAVTPHVAPVPTGPQCGWLAHGLPV